MPVRGGQGHHARQFVGAELRSSSHADELSSGRHGESVRGLQRAADVRLHLGLSAAARPGATFEYSNLGVGLLGHVLSLATGQPYEQMERKRVWEPLGMTNTAITLTPWMKQHLALGHGDNGEVVPNWDLPTFASAGAIRSTTLDMLKFASGKSASRARQASGGDGVRS